MKKKKQETEQYIEDIVEPFINEIQDKTDEIELLNLKLQQAEAKNHLKTYNNMDEFKNDYLNNLLNKEQMIRKYCLSDYMYNSIIKKLKLKREYTSKLKRILINNKTE